jgi:hypothetical protein
MDLMGKYMDWGINGSKNGIKGLLKTIQKN